MRFIFSMAIGVSSVFAGLSSQAQTLFTYGPNPVSKEEFLRVYQKNNSQKKPDFSATSVNQYVDLYALFKMKVKEAEIMQLDTNAAVKSELNNYKGQLARTYLSDKEVTKQLVNEAYNRMKEDLHVQHILVALRPNDDSVKAYQKIDSIYTAIVNNKADFAQLAKTFSDDKFSAQKGGDLGYLTAMQVVYPFETAAYNTPVGQVSKPFRTQFGYHIVKVTDRRPSKGQVQVEQIMIAAPKSKGEQGITDAKAKMNEVLAALKKGESFESLVKTYSEDKFSNEKGGLLEPFSVGKYSPEFESAAFGLKKPGDVSQPIQTEYGIHILKLVKRTPMQPLDSIIDNLTRKVENDGRAVAAKDAYMEKVKKQYGYKDYPENLDKLIAALPAQDNKNNAFNADSFKTMNGILFELAGKKYTQYDFAVYASGITRGTLMGNRATTLRDLYKMYQTTTINDLQQSDLEKNNADFRNLVKEYRDGILLFDLMDKNVWTKASKDTIGLASFYESNKAKYQWQPGFEGTVYQANGEVDLSRLKALMDKGVDASAALDSLGKSSQGIQVSQQTGRYEFTRFPVGKEYFVADKTSNVFRNDDGTYTMVFVNKLHADVEQKTLDEARGFVVADYQDYLEKQWNASLRAKYPVKVDDKTMKTVIK